MLANITLLMPCYNGLKYIAQAVNSVLAQSFQDWELIISDDGSKDGTAEYLKTLSDGRIKVHLQPKNLGIFGNLNFLFSQAKYPLAQILCQDDYLIGPDALDKILTAWRGLPAETAFLRCNHGCDGPSGLKELEQIALPSIIEPKDSDFFFFIFGCVPGNLSNVSVRTEVIAQMGGYRTDLPYAGDFEFWSRTGHTRVWALSKSHVVHVRRHADQASATMNKKGELLPQMSQIIMQLFERLHAQGYGSFDLRFYATANYVIRHLDAGVRDVLKGRGTGYLNLANRLLFTTECFLGRRSSWLMYLATAGGRWLVPSMASRLLHRRRTSVHP
jgi:glycosyltransferase involved in cell wall biosynthesis